MRLHREAPVAGKQRSRRPAGGGSASSARFRPRLPADRRRLAGHLLFAMLEGFLQDGQEARARRASVRRLIPMPSALNRGAEPVSRAFRWTGPPAPAISLGQVCGRLWRLQSKFRHERGAGVPPVSFGRFCSPSFVPPGFPAAACRPPEVRPSPVKGFRACFVPPSCFCCFSPCLSGSPRDAIESVRRAAGRLAIGPDALGGELFLAGRPHPVLTAPRGRQSVRRIKVMRANRAGAPPESVR